MPAVPPAHPVVVILSAPEDHPWPGLGSLDGEATLVYTTDGAALAEAMPEADVLLVTDFRTTAVRDAWPRAKKLRWVHAASAGVDALLFRELVESDVPLTNARGIFDRPIAEYVLGLILLYAKDFATTLHLQDDRRWRHRDTERIDGTHALVVGTGAIGREIGRLLRAAGLRVTGLSREPRADDPDFGVVHGADALHACLPDADVVVVAAPLTEATRGMFGAAEFRRMRPTARFINIARGPIVQTDALVDALRAGEIAGAALDVFEEEPLPADHPLWSMPQVVVSPHMAGDFHGWREALSRQFLDNFQRWRTGAPLQNLVDKRARAASTAEE